MRQPPSRADQAVRHRAAGRAPAAHRRPAVGRARQRQPALHQCRRRRGAARVSLSSCATRTGAPTSRDQQSGGRAARDGFSVSYARVCTRDAGRRSRYDAAHRGRADGNLEFIGDGEAVTDFLTARTGFVVLHPLEGVAGAPVESSTSTARVETRFPELVDPIQPFLDIRALTHEVLPGLQVDLPHGGRHLRDGGPPQLDRRLVQDLCPAARAALALHARQPANGSSSAVTLSVGAGNARAGPRPRRAPSVDASARRAAAVPAARRRPRSGRHAAAALGDRATLRAARARIIWSASTIAGKGHDARSLERAAAAARALGADLVARGR